MQDENAVSSSEPRETPVSIAGPPLYGAYQGLVEDLERADNELGEDLWLIAERIMLYRLTRAGEQKRFELGLLVNAIREIVSGTEGADSVPKEIIELGESAAEGFRGSNERMLSEVFTLAVDVAENMNSEELYRLIAFLRKAKGPEQEEINIEPLERTEEILSPYSDEWSEL